MSLKNRHFRRHEGVPKETVGVQGGEWRSLRHEIAITSSRRISFVRYCFVNARFTFVAKDESDDDDAESALRWIHLKCRAGQPQRRAPVDLQGLLS